MENLQYSTNYDELTVALQEDFQFQQMLQFDTGFSAQDFHDMRPLQAILTPYIK